MNFKMYENAKERGEAFIENSPIKSKCPGTIMRYLDEI